MQTMHTTPKASKQIAVESSMIMLRVLKGQKIDFIMKLQRVLLLTSGLPYPLRNNQDTNKKTEMQLSQ